MTLKELQIAVRTHNLTPATEDAKVYVEDQHGCLHHASAVEMEGTDHGPIVVLKFDREEVDL